jgi:3-phenylpropionate/cinnamic acid dioxygenase small subunit
VSGRAPDDRIALRLEIEDFNTLYADHLDTSNFDAWVELFTESAFYRITARENADAGLPAGIVYCEGKGMLKDRAFAIANTAMFAPRRWQHFITNTRVLSVEPDGTIRARSNYLILETLEDGRTLIHQSGTYHDRFERLESELRLKERDCVYDTQMIKTSMVFPA